MNRLIKGVARYDGTDFAGWQVQPGQRTVQGALEDALQTVGGEVVRIHGAGRTDAGVHALAQVFHFPWKRDDALEGLRRSLSALVGTAIRVDSLEEVSPDFHARFGAVGKRYGYAFCSGRETDPFSLRFAWRIKDSIDRHRMHELAQRFVGEHDFAGYQSSGSAVESTVRTIHSISLREGPVIGPCGDVHHWNLQFEGNGFLYKMIRNMVGTLHDVARGAHAESRIEEGLNSPGPYNGFTAPPHGLCLMEVKY